MQVSRPIGFFKKFPLRRSQSHLSQKSGKKGRNYISYTTNAFGSGLYEIYMASLSGNIYVLKSIVKQVNRLVK